MYLDAVPFSNRDTSLEPEMPHSVTPIHLPADSPSTHIPNLQKLREKYIKMFEERTPTRVAPGPFTTPNRATLKMNHNTPYNNFTSDRIKNLPERLRMYTGLRRKEVFDSLYNLFAPAMKKLPLVSNAPNEQLKPKTNTPRRRRGPFRSLNTEDQFVLTLIRLRRNLAEDVLSDMFQVSQSSISKYINTCIVIMAHIFRRTPLWRPKELIQKSLPEKFRMLPTLRVIIDCTEMEIERPSLTSSQKETFSQYKQRNTVKGLVGMSPDGQITFISRLYSGSTSDKKLTIHSGLLEQLDPGDMVMADRGFTIKEECESKGIQLLLPDFLQNSAQLTPEAVTNTREIAKLRIIVENKIGAIKNFRILHSKIPLTMSSIVEEIWTVCNYLTNFTIPLELEHNIEEVQKVTLEKLYIWK